MEAIGVNVNTIVANARTDELLGESQRLTAELQVRRRSCRPGRRNCSAPTPSWRRRRSCSSAQNRDIETKNLEIEQARQELEDRAHSSWRWPPSTSRSSWPT